MQHAEHLQPILAFLGEVGIPLREERIERDTFLPGIAIQGGVLVIDRERLQWPGDLLHEAGHLAVLPPAARQRASDDLQALAPDADADFAGELEALGWAYAAATAIGLPVDVLVHAGGYKGQSQSLIQMYALGIYPGLQGLCRAGMAESPAFMPACGPVHYPRMLKWLRD
jgi:hypothetical protein